MTENDDVQTGELLARARRAYELGRLQAAAWAALLLATGGALLGTLLVGPRAAAWAPLMFVLWLVFGWRGGALLRGARYGLVAGALTFVLPLWLLRPCCRWGSGGMTTVCTMPEMCVVLGALVGLPLSAWVLSRREAHKLELSAGMWLGVVSVAAFKCSALFYGEALGLLGGLALGMLAASALGSATARASRA
jgi:hypothetical protein